MTATAHQGASWWLRGELSFQPPWTTPLLLSYPCDALSMCAVPRLCLGQDRVSGASSAWTPRYYTGEDK